MKSLFLFITTLIATVLVGCVTTDGQPNVAVTNTNGRVVDDYQIFRVGDKIKIEFSGSEQIRIQPIETEIKDDGTVSFEHIGAVKVEGKTARDVEKAVREAYVPKYYKQLNVVVSSPERVYYVGGQVKQPGLRPYLGRVTVLQAIAAAGDFTDFADKKSVVVTRPSGQRVVVDCKKAISKPSLDIEVFPNDRVHVPQGL